MESKKAKRSQNDSPIFGYNQASSSRNPMLISNENVQNISPIQTNNHENRRESKDQHQIINNLSDKLNQMTHALNEQQEDFK